MRQLFYPHEDLDKHDQSVLVLFRLFVCPSFYVSTLLDSVLLFLPSVFCRIAAISHCLLHGRKKEKKLINHSGKKSVCSGLMDDAGASKCRVGFH